MANIFWDTNLFIYLLEENPDFGHRVRDLRRRMRARGDRLVTSALTVSEVLVKPVGKGEMALARRYEAILTGPEVRVLPFDFTAAKAYARVRQDRAIAPSDAIQLACAAAAGIDLFITNDDRLSRAIVPGIHFITSLASAPL